MKREGVPHGGFVFVSATGLLATWWAYKRGLIQFRDFRVWLATHELTAQRCVLEKGRVPRFRVEELGALIGGVGGEHLRASVRRLEAIGVLSWSEQRLVTLGSLDAMRTAATEELQVAVESVTNHRRKIPVPRRLLRLLARSTRPVLVATALGHLLRCMYYRKGQCAPSGLCKASWIAANFEVDERNVKAARQELESLGILLRDPASQYRLNRWGVPMRFNLEWEIPTAKRQSPPRRQQSTTETPPPRETGNSSFGRSENQKPVHPESGVRKRTGRGPTLRHITELDLIDPRRTLELHRQAAAAGLIGSSESDRLKVLALAVHARVHAKRNAPGLFITGLRKGRWYLTLSDEDQSRKAFATAWRPIRSGIPGSEEGMASPSGRPRGSPNNDRNAFEPESRESVRGLIARSLKAAGALDDR